jgi:hypothetical protein
MVDTLERRARPTKKAPFVAISIASPNGAPIGSSGGDPPRRRSRGFRHAPFVGRRRRGPLVPSPSVPVRVLHHGRCFDGAASAGLFARFYRDVVDPKAEFEFRAKHHVRDGDPFTDDDFAADVVACLDFRYSARAQLDWYFDHHHSAFQLPGEREHFDADGSGRKFHDPTAPCCATYMARIMRNELGYAAEGHEELLRWAEMIDAARFPSPDIPVAMKEPGVQLAAFIQSANDPAEISKFIGQLLTVPFAELAGRPYVRSVVDPRIRAHAIDCEVISRVSRVESGVLEYDLLDEGPRILSHFIPYAQNPHARYVVGAYAHLDGDLRLTVGYNPWLPPEERTINLADVCRRYGGGGHPYVAGCNFDLGDTQDLREVAKQVAAELRAAG